MLCFALQRLFDQHMFDDLGGRHDTEYRGETD